MANPSRLNLARALEALLVLAAVALMAIHAVHLRADFPNFSRWTDWSKYTDEGWYGDAAIRHYLLGHWYVAGDFNPAVALPILPLAEALVFHFTGVSVVAARALTVAIFGGILVAGWFLLRFRRVSGSKGGSASSLRPGSLAAGVAVLLLAANPFCFVFTRMAIIEPLLVLLTLLAVLVASREQLPPPVQAQMGVEVPGYRRVIRQGWAIVRANLATIVGLGVLLPVMVLTKTTALFLVPAVAWMLFARAGYRIPQFLRVAVPAGVLAAGLWLLYFVLLVRPHYLLDYRYLFSANAYTEMTRDNFVSVLATTVMDGKWMGRVFYPVSLLAVLAALASPRRLACCPLIPTLMLWAGGYMAFLAYHNNLQPRYYLVVAVPLTLVLPLIVEDVLLPLCPRGPASRLALAASALILAAIILPDAAETVRYVRHPEYTLVSAAAQIRAYIEQDRKQDPDHSPLILSISGSDISLMTGLPSICDDFGTLELVDRIEKYQPGWYVAWNAIEDDKMDAIAPLYYPERVAAFPAMDDPDRNLMILYRLEEDGGYGKRHGRPAEVPRRLRTRVGQQPSTSQLKH